MNFKIRIEAVDFCFGFKMLRTYKANPKEKKYLKLNEHVLEVAMSAMVEKKLSVREASAK